MTPKKLLSIISHRTVLVAVMLLLQVGIFVAAILRFSEYFVYFYLLCVLVSLFAVLYIINTKSDPGYKIAWIVPILLVPVFGGLIYLLCGGTGVSKKLGRKLEETQTRFARALEGDKKRMPLPPLAGTR